MAYDRDAVTRQLNLNLGTNDARAAGSRAAPVSAAFQGPAEQFGEGASFRFVQRVE